MAKIKPKKVNKSTQEIKFANKAEFKKAVKKMMLPMIEEKIGQMMPEIETKAQLQVAQAVSYIIAISANDIFGVKRKGTNELTPQSRNKIDKFMDSVLNNLECVIEDYATVDDFKEQCEKENLVYELSKSIKEGLTLVEVEAEVKMEEE